jgi:hypothetical protein
MKPMISTVRTILDLKHAWRIDPKVSKSNLRFELPPDHPYGTPITQAEISLFKKRKSTTRKGRVTYAMRKHTKQILSRGIRLVFGAKALDRLHNNAPKGPESRPLYFMIIVITHGRTFLKDIANSEKVARLIFHKDPLEDKWIMKVIYKCPNQTAIAGSKWCAVYWNGEDVINRTGERVYVFDFEVELPILHSQARFEISP